MNQNNQQPGSADLPPLPKPHQSAGEDAGCWFPDFFDAEQMQQYARDAIAASRRAAGDCMPSGGYCFPECSPTYQAMQASSLPDVAMPDQFEEIRALLTEVHQFNSTSPVAKSNISAALDLLDEIESAAQPAEGSAQVDTSDHHISTEGLDLEALGLREITAEGSALVATGEQDQAHVMPPFAAPASQHDADFDALLRAIMNFPARLKDSDFATATDRLNYKTGHRDARHDACDLVAEFASGFREGRNTSSESVGKFIAAEGATPADALLVEVADVLAENNWRGDLQERLRERARMSSTQQPTTEGDSNDE